jgi:hypothetical protein
MAKSIKLTDEEWMHIRKQLKEEYECKPSVLIVRDVMRRELGFTTRYHTEWVPDPGYDGYGQYKEFVFLDFFNDEKETFFRLKYL